jgi:hypothetical protein
MEARMIRILLLLFCLVTTTLAQELQATFPPDATPIEEAVLKAKLSGKTFTMPGANKNHVRVEYRENGWAYLNTIGTYGAFNTSGRWRVEGTILHVDWNRLPKGGGEVRLHEGSLYLKRFSDDQVVQLTPQ